MLLGFGGLLKGADEIPEGLSGGQEREVWDVLVSWQEARQQSWMQLQMQCPATEQSRAIRAASIEPGAVERVILVDGDSLHSRTALLEVLDQKGVDIDRVVPQEGSGSTNASNLAGLHLIGRMRT